MRSDWLDAFLIFSESMNFTRAAEALHISQPALHVKIKQLSSALERPLYRRVGRNLVLTDAGERVAAHAREQRERAIAFEEELRSGADRSPTILCAGAGAYLYLLGPAISRFSQKGDRPISLLTGDRDHTIASVAFGRAQIGVTALNEHPKGLAVTTLTDVDQVLVMPRNHLLAGKSELSLRDLAGAELIVPPPDRPHRIMLSRMLMDVGVDWQVSVEANGWELMMHFVALGMGLAVVNGHCRPPSGLTARPLRGLPGIRYHILTRPGMDRHAGAAALMTMLLETADDWRKGR